MFDPGLGSTFGTTDKGARVAPSVDRSNVLERLHAGGATRSFGEPAIGVRHPPAAPNPPQFFPVEPASLEAAHVSPTLFESLVLKFLLTNGTATGREIVERTRLPFAVVSDQLRRMKTEQLIAYRQAAGAADFEHQLTKEGYDRAERDMARCTYCQAAPVPLEEYCRSIVAQSIRRERPTLEALKQALRGLSVQDHIVSSLGQAVSSGESIFLFGAPGNGKTSIAERLVRAYGETIWIPRAVYVDGEIMRIYDPVVHVEEKHASGAGRPDARWVSIRRPTVIVGGELTLEHLEVRRDKLSGVLEAPVHLKSNGGALIVDDFGRQRMAIHELLNRWIVPLDRRYDFISTPGGKKLQIPFEQFVVFATNLLPRELGDEAFLRRIPYKIEAADPREDEFRRLIQLSAQQFQMECPDTAIDYLIAAHYRESGRSFRYCHPRDLMTQARNFCQFHYHPFVVTPESLDSAVRNLFAGCS